MIYRKRLLLAIVETFVGEINATDFQKLLFLFSEMQSKKSYNFIPYKYGCFSFQSLADKTSLINEGYLRNSNNWTLLKMNSDFINTITLSDKQKLHKLKNRFSSYSTKELIRVVYLNYPYYAINSEIKNQYLSENELDIIEKINFNFEEFGLFTIGYEGISLEEYLNVLIKQNIKVLCDVRKNAISRKYGFSKKTLINACESVNIKYFHIPELGIDNIQRKNLKKQIEYDNLFHYYEENVLPNQKASIRFIHDLIKKYRRVVLTCYEAMPKQCHRSIVAKAVYSLDNKIMLQHLSCQGEKY